MPAGQEHVGVVILFPAQAVQIVVLVLQVEHFTMQAFKNNNYFKQFNFKLIIILFIY